ncbi:hypothetical protein L596_017061 [Steinernema carpocapsae]|uniref:Uncharacterized protein n=1 Tax=Steinernema carpocapsae TaxID=34508 RepID=A0A4U5N1A7_STECR|nr:hypothetical protein L596_017061 [Steinernema carpocapsae]
MIWTPTFLVFTWFKPQNSKTPVCRATTKKVGVHIIMWHTVQRRLSWPLRKDDTQIRNSARSLRHVVTGESRPKNLLNASFFV